MENKSNFITSNQIIEDIPEIDVEEIDVSSNKKICRLIRRHIKKFYDNYNKLFKK